jgi:hypothetical protein
MAGEVSGVSHVVRTSIKEERQLWELYREPPTLACVKVLKEYLFAAPLRFVRGDGAKMLPQFEDRIVHRHWNPFAKSVLDSFLATGIALVKFVRKDRKRVVDRESGDVSWKGGNLVPIVVDHFSYDVEIVLDADHNREYRCYRRWGRAPKMARADPSIIVLEYEPPEIMFPDSNNGQPGASSIEARYRGPISALMKVHSFIKTVRRNALQADTRAADPPTHLESASSGSGPRDMTDAAHYDTTAGAQASAQDRMNYFRGSMAVLSMQSQFTDLINSSDPVRDRKGDDIDPDSEIPMAAPTTQRAWERKMIPIADGFKVASVTLPTTVINLIEAERLYQGHVCAVLQVGRDLLYNDQYRAENSESPRRLLNAVKAWREVLMNALGDIYEHLYGVGEALELSKAVADADESDSEDEDEDESEGEGEEEAEASRGNPTDIMRMPKDDENPERRKRAREHEKDISKVLGKDEMTGDEPPPMPGNLGSDAPPKKRRRSKSKSKSKSPPTDLVRTSVTVEFPAVVDYMTILDMVEKNMMDWPRARELLAQHLGVETNVFSSRSPSDVTTDLECRVKRTAPPQKAVAKP